MTVPLPECKLSKRYPIRALTIDHLQWTKAIFVQANTSPSSIWPALNPGNQTILAYRQFHAVDYLIRHTITSGLSFGVFDTQCEYRFPSSARTGGKLHWDENDTTATADELLQQLDFPLVSIAMSYDAAEPPDDAKNQEYYKIVLVVRQMFGYLESLVPASAREGYAGAGRGKVLMRRATTTRGDYEGQGTMKSMAWWLMGEAKRWGYEVIEIRTGHAAVRRVWENPPKPFCAAVMAELVVGDYEVVDGDGKKRRPYEGVNVGRCRLRIDLSP